jgi:SAM-dependent methyltransferase
MPSNLERVASRLQCPRCLAASLPGRPRAAAWQVMDDGRRRALVCRACRATYPCEDGVLVLIDGCQDPEIAREREAARQTERDPALGGMAASFDDLSRAEGALAEAMLALPYGDGSRYYDEPGYFANVRSSAAGFTFVLQNIGARPGERLLDLGADLTWSTSHFARRGLECTGVDINHHLPIARLFERGYGISYDLVQADMTDVPFTDAAFDVVVAFNALHHGNRLGALAGHIARILAPGGRLGFVEPYCQAEADKEAFGRAQIGAGISEHVYLLEEWHRAFAQAGLVVRTHRVADSFAAIYEKPSGPVAPPPESRASRDDLFAGFYDGRLTVLLDPPPMVRPGETFDVVVRVENLGRHTWCTNSYFLVRASYHLHRAGATAELGDLVAWDNVRTPLPTAISPRDAVTMALKVTAPATAGDYVAEIDLLQEYISWFAPHGVESPRVRFRVVR